MKYKLLAAFFRAFLIATLLVAPMVLPAQQVSRIEYFVNTDPGFGNGVTVPFSPAHDVNASFNIDVNALSVGFHNLYIRSFVVPYDVVENGMQVRKGGWSLTNTKAFYKENFQLAAAPGNIVKGEYFIDNDPGFGQGTNLPFTPGQDLSTLSFAFDVTSLDGGFHNLYVRFQNDLGTWGFTFVRSFYKENISLNAAPPSPIIAAEYFVDSDPGFGNGVSLSVVPGNNLTSFNFSFDITSLSAGFHNLYVRFKDSYGRWSMTNVRSFYKQDFNSTNSLPNIVSGEYFIDNDPGFGNGQSISVSQSANLSTLQFAIDISALPAGFHQVYTRFKDANGGWSHTTSKAFYKQATAGSGSSLADVTRVEYFIDADPGFGNGINVNITPGSDLSSISFPIDMASLGIGEHRIYVRAMNANGDWSLTGSGSFQVEAALPNSPAINSFFPASASLGETVTIKGTNFTGATQVSFGGISASSFSITNDTTISAVLANGKTGFVVVTTPNGNASANGFTYLNYSAPGNTLKFDGIDDHVRILHHPTLTPSGQITIETWLRPADIHSNQSSVIYKKEDASSQQLLSFREYGTTLVFGLVVNSGYQELTIPIVPSDYENQWVHIAATFDGTTKKIYRNGILIGSQSSSGSMPAAGSQSAYLGSNAGAGEFFNGSLDEFRIWSIARTEADIKTYILNVVAPGSGNLVAYYNFDLGQSGQSNIYHDVLVNTNGNALLNGQLFNFSLSATDNSNWLESYAMVIPGKREAVNITTTGFTARWTPPTVGAADNYLLDVSLSPSFASFVPGYQSLNVNQLTSYAVTGLKHNTTYYYRLRANKASVSNQGSYSETNSAATEIAIPYITNFSPTNGAIGSSVIITGVNFSPVAVENEVYFGTMKAAVTNATATSLTVTVPTAANFLPLSVTTGGLTTYSATPFIVRFPAYHGFDSSSFAPRVDYSFPANPYSSIVGDLDNDGKLDLIVTNSTGNTVSVIQNASTSGSVNLLSKQDLPSANAPNGICVADIDGDGKLDIVSTNYSSNSVSVFRNTSVGNNISFAGRVDFAVGVNPMNVAVNDFNRDGRPDLVVVNSASNSLSILQNQGGIGSISFATKVDFITGQNPLAVIVNDINRDGKPDMLAANYTSKTISVFEGLTGSEPITTNSFRAKIDFPVSGQPQNIVAGDLNNDGKDDLIVAGNYQNGGIYQGFGILQNVISGNTINTNTFSSEVLFSQGHFCNNAALDDINGDGYLDIILTNNNLNSVSVLRNLQSAQITSASFDSVFHYATGVNPYNVNTGDIDGDGKPDIVAINHTANSLSVFRNTLHLLQNQTIEFDTIPEQLFGASYVLLHASSSSNLPVSFEALNGAVQVKGDTLYLIGAGPVSIKAMQNGNRYFHPALPVTRNFEIKKTAQSIFFDSISNQVVNTIPIPLLASASSGLPVSFSVLSGNAGIQNNQLVLHGGGPITIRASQTGSSNYNAAFADRSFCATPSSIDSITGFAETCPATLQCRIRKTPGVNYTWSATGGNIISSSDTAVTIQWLTIGQGNVSVLQQVSCSDITVTKSLDVTITQPIMPAAISNAFPLDNAMIRMLPFSISWQPAAHTHNYELYIWPEGSSPASPYKVTTDIVVNIESLPAFAPGKRYFWKVVSTNSCGQTSSDNFSFEIAQLPNLKVQNVTVPATTVFSGNTMDVSFSVLNNGLASADFSQWSDAIYLSTDQSMSDNDIYIGGRANVSYLSVGQQYNSTIQVRLPENSIGQYYLIVVTNRYRQLTESNDADNAVSKSLIINLTPPPDLQVTSVITPQDAFTTQSINVQYVVKNKGGGATVIEKWSDKIYLCPEPIFDPIISIPLGEVSHTSGYLYPDSGYSISRNVILPSQVFGVYYVFVVTDVNKNVYEFTFENNNTARNDSIRIFLTPPPDFQVTNWSTPSKLTAAERTTINYTVQNKGASKPFFGGYVEQQPRWYNELKWIDAVFISREPVFNSASATLIGLSVPKTKWNEIICPWTPTEDELKKRFPPREFIGVGRGSSSSYSGSPSSSSVAFDFVKNGKNAGISSSRSYPISVLSEQEAEDNDNQIPIRVGGMSAAPTLCSKAIYADMLPNENYNQAIPIKIPDTLSGVYYLYLFTDVTDTIFEYTKENNNIIGAQIEILNPDLIVTNVNVSGSFSSGNRINTQWTIKNQGNGKVLPRTRKDFIWLSPTPVFNSQTAVLLDSLTYNASLDTAASLVRQKDVKLPDGISGTYYLFIETDKFNKVFESTETNNSAFSNSFQVQLTPWPDLVFTAFDFAEDTLQFNQSFNAKLRLANKGTANLLGKTWSDQLSSSLLPNYPLTLSPFKAIPNQQAILAGDSITIETPLVAANEILQGSIKDTSFYLYAKADGLQSIYEHTGENNNLFRSKPFYYLSPDLQVSNIKMIDSVKSGTTVSTEWTVKNVGGRTGLLSPGWGDAIYLSTDSILNGSSIQIGGSSFSGYLDRDSSYTSRANATVPNGLHGDFFVVTVVDAGNNLKEANRTNNTNVHRSQIGQAQKIHVSLTPPADLKPLNFVTPNYGLAGQPIQLKWKIANQGTGNAKASWKEQVYLSTDRVISNNDIQLGNYVRRANLDVGQEYVDSLQVTLPISAEGNYYLLLATDIDNVVYEFSAENNNLTSSSIFITKPKPSDLIVSSITIPGQALAGAEVVAEWKVKNIGINPATGYFKQGLYISKDSTWNSNAILLSNPDANINIPPQGDMTTSSLVKLKGITPGNYYFIVRTDLSNHIIESVETNNESASTTKINIGIKELPFYVITRDTLMNNDEMYYRLEIPDSLEGETVLVSLKGNTLNGVNELYLRFDSVPTRNRYDHAFESGGVSDHDVVIPVARKGTYYILIYSTSTKINGQPITLLAEKISFGVHSIATNEGGNSGLVTVKIKGAKFEPGTQIKLSDVNLGAINAQLVQFVNSTTLFATFNLKDKPLGVYDVWAKNASQDSTALARGFKIIKGQGAGFQGSGGAVTNNGFYCTIRNIEVDDLMGFDVQTPDNVRLGTRFIMTLNFGNSGNVDIPMPTRVLVSVTGDPISLTTEGLSQGKKELYLEFKELGGPEGILRPGATGSIKIYVQSVALVNRMQFQLIE